MVRMMEIEGHLFPPCKLYVYTYNHNTWLVKHIYVQHSTILTSYKMSTADVIIGSRVEILSVNGYKP